MVELNKECGFSDEAWKRFFLEQNYFQLLVAFYHDQKPHLYTIDIDWCLAIPSKTQYCAIGIGKNMAEFLIREYLQIDPRLELAFPIAVSVIEKTIDNVDRCGRPTWVGMAFPMPEKFAAEYEDRKQSYYKSLASIVDRQIIDLVAPELKAAEAKSANERKGQLAEILKNVSKKHLEMITQQVNKEFKI